MHRRRLIITGKIHRVPPGAIEQVRVRQQVQQEAHAIFPVDAVGVVQGFGLDDVPATDSLQQPAGSAAVDTGEPDDGGGVVTVQQLPLGFDQDLRLPVGGTQGRVFVYPVAARITVDTRAGHIDDLPRRPVSPQGQQVFHRPQVAQPVAFHIATRRGGGQQRNIGGVLREPGQGDRVRIVHRQRGQLCGQLVDTAPERQRAASAGQQGLADCGSKITTSEQMHASGVFFNGTHWYNYTLL